MSTTARTWTKIVSWLVGLAGVVMLVAGIIAWSMVSSELSGQKIDLAEQGQKANIANGPFDALAQIALIKEHTETQMTGPANEGGFGFAPGTTYSMVPRPDGAALAQCRATQAAGGELSTDCQAAITNDAARTYLDNSNFKQASLYTSVMAFGVSFLVVGLGIVFLLIGSAGIVATSKKSGASGKAVSPSGEKVSVTV